MVFNKKLWGWLKVSLNWFACWDIPSNEICQAFDVSHGWSGCKLFNESCLELSSGFAEVLACRWYHLPLPILAVLLLFFPLSSRPRRRRWELSHLRGIWIQICWVLGGLLFLFGSRSEIAPCCWRSFCQIVHPISDLASALLHKVLVSECSRHWIVITVELMRGAIWRGLVPNDL